ncbi:adenine phosphoribosyltransferase [Alphaproteobacteria bacterium]|nr:adenine phosphoribosyltransferase [Alphaproteobacteria bacterium]
MKEYVRTILDYPVKGIQFRDITTLLQNAGHFKQVIDEMTTPWINKKIDAVLSIESRGFIMAGAIAYKLNSAFIPFRKPDKLPGETYKVAYTLEYGSTEMHVHKDALDGHTNLLIIDDLLATGGTALAAIELVNMFKNKNIIGAGFIINLPELKGDQKLINKGINIHSLMEF